MTSIKRLPFLRQFSISSRIYSTPQITDIFNGARDHWTANEEPRDAYSPSGHHQVKVGDILGDCYVVRRKLGWGMFSTVWLVEHQSHKTLAALKLLSSEATDALGSQLQELNHLQLMRNRSPLHPGYKHVVHFCDHVQHQGTNGKHSCIVTEALCENMHSFGNRWKNRALPRPLLKLVTRQVILALDYLHNECNIVHADIKPADIMLVPPEGFFTAENIAAPFETSVESGPDGHPLIRARSRPLTFPLPKGDPNTFETWKDTEVRVGDLGISCQEDKASEHFAELISRPPFRAPEVCIGSGWGKPADIWSLGCTVFELCLGISLFSANCHARSIPYLHAVRFGPYPIEMVKQGKFSDIYYESDGSLNMKNLPKHSLEQILHGDEGTTPSSALFLSLLKRMLTVDPIKRATCQELLAHEWLYSYVHIRHPLNRLFEADELLRDL